MQNELTQAIGQGITIIVTAACTAVAAWITRKLEKKKLRDAGKLKDNK